jgi:PAS domain S-box-containing protein
VLRSPAVEHSLASAPPLKIWVAGAAAADARLRARLQAAGIEPCLVPGDCAVVLVDFRAPSLQADLLAVRASAQGRALLLMALVADGTGSFQGALQSGADAFIVESRLETEAPARLELLLRRQPERDSTLRHERDLAALIDLTSDYASTRDVTELLYKVTRRLADELGIARCALVIFDEEKQQGRIVAASDELGRSDRVVDLAQYPELREVARKNAPLLLPDAPNHPLLDTVKDRLVGKSIGTIAALPVAVQSRVLGALLLRAGEGRPTFSAREMAFATTVAHATAVALRNVSLLQHAEAQVASLSRYESFFDSFFHGIAILAEDGRLLRLNSAGARMLGLEAPVTLSRIAELVSPATVEAVQELMHRARTGLARAELDVLVTRTDGERLTLAISVALLGSQAGPGLDRTLICCFRDVTAARATQTELQKTKEFMERLIDQAADAIIAADMTGTVIVFNRGAERICGYRAEEALGKLNVRNLYPTGTAAKLMRKIRAPEHGGPGRLDSTRTEILGKGGAPVPVNMTAALITEEVGGTVREVATVGIFSDLRDRMRLEETLSLTQEKLQQTERTALVAELAGAAAHELNQPLTSIMGYSELLRRRLRDDDPSTRNVDIIYREAERMADIVRKIGKITRYETKAYVGGARIVDIDRATGEGEP